jgi:outer membrane protein assembly factor BamB
VTEKPTIAFCFTLALVLAVGCTCRAQRPASTDEREQLQFRTWTDTTGRYQTEAAMIKFADGKVHLKKRDGRTIAVSSVQLSKSDQQYVREELARRRALEAEAALTSGDTARSTADWPGFLGPNRDGISPDTGLLRAWPQSGPPLLWEVNNLGGGWSSVAVADGCVYTTGNSGDRQMLICLELGGKEKWRVAQGPKCRHGKYDGARSTPTVDGDRIYVTGGNGLVSCHRTENGRIVWERDMKAEMRGSVGGWLYSESVLILDNLAIVTPGGSNAIVALDKMTGREVWKSDVNAKAGYSSCIAITEGGSTVIVNGSQSGLLVVDAKTGRGIYTHEFAVNNTANCPTPAYEDGRLFWSVGYGRGGVCLRVHQRGGKWSFEEIWRTRDLNCHPGNYVVADGSVYGKGRRGLTCIDLKTGQTKWSERIGAGQVCWADGMLYSFADSGGRISLVAPSAESANAAGTFKVAGQGSSWAHPVVIGGRLYLRYDTNLYCYDVRAG